MLGSSGTKKIKEKQAEEMDDSKADDENVPDRHPATLESPPPSQISIPSPSPPPRIFAEDLKKDKKKRERPDDKFLDAKRKRLGKGNELLLVMGFIIIFIITLHLHIAAQIVFVLIIMRQLLCIIINAINIKVYR